MFDYDYLEPQTTRAGDNPLYHMARDLEKWLKGELEKRRTQLEADNGPEVRIYLTMRTFRKWPVFTLGLPQEDGKKVLEAWYFHMGPPTAEEGNCLQLLLDRVSLRQLFPEQKLEPKPEAPGEPKPEGPEAARPGVRGGRTVARLNQAPQARVQPARKAQVRPQAKPKGFE